MRRHRPAPTNLNDMADLLFRDVNGRGWSLVTWLAEARFLTNDLVALRFYPTCQGVRSATYRLAQLASWGIIASRGLRHSRQAWHLTEQGARLVAEHLGKPASEMNFDGAEARVNEAYVHLRLHTARFEVALRTHASRNQGQVVGFVWGPQVETDRGPFRPDMAFIYGRGGCTWNYALLVDQNTERPASLVTTRIASSQALTGSGWRRLWDEMPACLVLTTEGGLERASRLHEQMATLPRPEGPCGPIRFVAADALYLVPLSHAGNLPELQTRFEQPVCLEAFQPPTLRCSVFD